MNQTISAAQPALLDPRDVNQLTAYAMWSAFRVRRPLADDRPTAEDVEQQFAALSAEGLTVRGWYDLSGMRADADLLLWTHAPDVRTLQNAYRAVRRSELGRHLEAVWSGTGLHRPAEFNKSHVPAFLTGEPPREYLCFYPFVRSYEWYLLDADERRGLLAEHGRVGRAYPDVRANTMPAFALGDHEWLLAFEADDLARILDMMRDLRATGARHHVRVETPFFTGRRTPLAELIDALP